MWPQVLGRARPTAFVEALALSKEQLPGLRPVTHLLPGWHMNATRDSWDARKFVQGVEVDWVLRTPGRVTCATIPGTQPSREQPQQLMARMGADECTAMWPGHHVAWLRA